MSATLPLTSSSTDRSDEELKLNEIFGECSALLRQGGGESWHDLTRKLEIPSENFIRFCDASNKIFAFAAEERIAEMEDPLQGAKLRTDLQRALARAASIECGSVQKIVKSESYVIRSFLSRLTKVSKSTLLSEVSRVEDASQNQEEQGSKQSTSRQDGDESKGEVVVRDTAMGSQLRADRFLFKLAHALQGPLSFGIERHILFCPDARLSVALLLGANRSFKLANQVGEWELNAYYREYGLDCMLRDNPSLIRAGVLAHSIIQTNDRWANILDAPNHPDFPGIRLFKDAYDASPNLNPAERVVLWQFTENRATNRFIDGFWRYRTRYSRHWLALRLFMKARNNENKRLRGEPLQSAENQEGVEGDERDELDDGRTKLSSRVGHIKASSHLSGFEEYWRATFRWGDWGMLEDHQLPQ